MPPRRTLLAATLALVASPPLALAAAPPDGRFLAVGHRFETGADDTRLAVLVLERAGESRGRLVVAADRLPVEARHPDAVLEVVVDDGDLASARYLPEETTRRAERAQADFDRLAHGRCGEG